MKENKGIMTNTKIFVITHKEFNMINTLPKENYAIITNGFPLVSDKYDIITVPRGYKDEIGGIVDLMLADLRSRLADKQLKLVVTDAAKSVIVDDGYDPIYGARPLKRYIQANVETMIAKEIIGGNHVPGDTLTVDAENGKLVLR